MTRPSRATASGRVYLDLLARARRESRPSDELLTLYVLERLLYRLSVSAHRDRLILKGGMLLSAFGQRRPTRDIDLLAKTTSSEPSAVAALVREIAAVDVDDGVVYETSQMTTRMIREQDHYAAVRVAMPPAPTGLASRCVCARLISRYHGTRPTPDLAGLFAGRRGLQT